MPARRLLLMLLLLLLLVHLPPLPAAPSPIGINYGQIADDLPTPSSVIPLLKSLGVAKVKLYDTNPTILRSFAGTGVEIVVGLPDQSVPKVANDSSAALAWVKSNVSPYLPATKISAVTVGNEVFAANDTAEFKSLLPAMQAVHSALASLGLDRQVAVTTAHSLAILGTSYPPSAAAFRRELVPYMSQIVAFLAKTGAPFLINAYPYFAYKADPKRVPLDYVLFEPNPGVVDPKSGLRYDNMLHAQVDAVRVAIAAAAVGEERARAVEVRVSETGWPSNGDEDEAGATPENARRYNGNLIRMVAGRKGTPMRPEEALEVYVFALFNENLKPGPASERNYGLFKPDGTPAYNLGIPPPVSAIASASSPTGGVPDPDSPARPGPGPGPTSGAFLTGSAAYKTELPYRFGLGALKKTTVMGLSWGLLWM